MMNPDRHRIRITCALLLTAAIGVAGCVAQPGGTAAPSASLAEAPAASPAGSSAASPASSPVRTIPRVSPPATLADGDGVPAAITTAVLNDVAQRTGVEPGSVVVIRAEPTVWPSGALGCPEPGKMYTQALEPGYRLVVEAGGQRLDYRVTERGSMKLCENPGPG